MRGDRAVEEAQDCAIRSAKTVTLFVVWLLLTWVGQGFEPSGGWRWQVAVAALLVYSILSAVTLVNLVKDGVVILCRGEFRSVLNLHLAPFWLVTTLSTTVGLGVSYMLDGDPFGPYLGAGVGAAVLLGAFAVARVIQARRLAKEVARLSVVPLVPLGESGLPSDRLSVVPLVHRRAHSTPPKTPLAADSADAH